MSDFEMATLRQRALEAQRTKAQRGELWMHLPVGLVYGPTGAIELDPDARVQQAIRLVLQKFDELGSTRQVLLWLRRERLSVPVTRGGKAGRYTEWASPMYTRVHAIVTNPFLAGAYVYGRSDDASREILLVMHWQGGRHTELRVARPWSGRTKRCTDAEAIALVRRMAGRWHDDAMAMQLNLLGWKPGTGHHGTRMRVRELRSRRDLPACDPTPPTWLTAKGAATHLGISPAYAGLLLKRGVIPGTQAVPGRMWWVDPAVLDSPPLRDTLHALSERRVKRPHDDRTLRFPGLSEV